MDGTYVDFHGDGINEDWGDVNLLVVLFEGKGGPSYNWSLKIAYQSTLMSPCDARQRLTFSQGIGRQKELNMHIKKLSF